MRKTKIKRPREFKDCLNIPEPCPYVGCSQHLLWVKKKNWKRISDRELLDLLFSMNQTCLIKTMIKYRKKYHKSGVMPFEDMAIALDMTKQAARQILIGYDNAGKNGAVQTTPGILNKIRKKYYNNIKIKEFYKEL